MPPFGAFTTSPTDYASSPFMPRVEDTIPSPATVNVAPRSRAAPLMPAASVTSAQPFLPGANASQLLDANANEQRYKAAALNDLYWQHQRQMAPQPTTPIPGAYGPPSPSSSSSSAGPAAPTASQIPGVGVLRMTRDDGTTVSAPIPSAPQSGPQQAIPGAPVTADPAFGQLSSFDKQQVQSSNPGAYGTLKGSFQQHDAAGNAIPGAYSTVDASGVRDTSNLQGIAKSNYINSPQGQNDLAGRLQNDPKYAALQKQTQDVKNATAARMPVPLYQQMQKLTGAPSTEQDVAALSPKDRLAYQQKQKMDTQNAEIQNRKLELQRNKQINDSLGGLGKFVIGGLKEVGNWLKQGADKVKTDQQRQQFEQNFRLRAEEAWANQELKMRKSWADSQKTEVTPDDMPADQVAAARSEFMKHIYGQQNTPQSPTPTSTATGAAVSPTPAAPASSPQGQRQPLVVNGVNFTDNGDGTITHPNGHVYRVENGKIVARVR